MPLSLRSPDLPPFRLLVLGEAGDAFAHASAHALDLGGGTLVFDAAAVPPNRKGM
jgi:hypothetical protein